MKCEKGYILLDCYNKWVLFVYGMKKWLEEKLNFLIGLWKIFNDDIKIVYVFFDEEYDLVLDFEFFLVENEVVGEDDKNVDVYNGVGYRLKLKWLFDFNMIIEKVIELYIIYFFF